MVFNSLSSGRCGYEFQYVNSKHNLCIDILSIQQTAFIQHDNELVVLWEMRL